MAKRRTRKQKIKTKLKKAKKLEIEIKMEPESKTDKKQTKLIVKDLKKTVLITMVLLAILGLVYWKLG